MEPLPSTFFQKTALELALTKALGITMNILNFRPIILGLRLHYYAIIIE